MSSPAEGATALCPKHMVYGPCGAVDFDGTCEIGDAPCPFVDRPVTAWHGIETPGAPAAIPSAPPERIPSARATLDMLADHQIVVADFPALTMDVDAYRACAEVLVGEVDAVLSGDTGEHRVQFPPTYRAHLLREMGLVPFVGVNCRDRNRVALEGEAAGLAAAGVGVLHTVTGDHPDSGQRPDAQPVFDLDSTEMASVARTYGHLVSVGESPSTPPRGSRAARLREKVLAGADLCFVNHCGGVEPARRFIGEAAELGISPVYIPCVPVILDEDSAATLRSFPTLVLPDGYLDRILGAADPIEAGIEEAVRLSLEFLSLDGVGGVDLSGGAARESEVQYAEHVAEISRRIRLG